MAGEVALWEMCGAKPDVLSAIFGCPWWTGPVSRTMWEADKSVNPFTRGAVGYEEDFDSE